MDRWTKAAALTGLLAAAGATFGVALAWRHGLRAGTDTRPVASERR